MDAAPPASGGRQNHGIRGRNPVDDPEPARLRTLVDWAEARLARAPLSYGHGTDNARDEAAWLVLHGAGLSPVDTTVDPETPVDADAVAAVRRLVARRLQERRPAAYLTGRAWFAGLELAVDERVPVPRSPLAEPILERFDPWIGARPVGRILDLGTGSGCLAIACARAFPEARVDATDVAPDALELAAANVRRHGLDDRVVLHRADVYDGLAAGRYDLIVSNPPYVDTRGMEHLPAEYRHEPARALAAGPLGLEIAERILAGARERLTPAGVLVVEVGGAAAALERRHPRLAFTWLALEQGGEGVFLLGAADLGGA